MPLELTDEQTEALIRELSQISTAIVTDLPPEKWTPGYADFASARSGVM